MVATLRDWGQRTRGAHPGLWPQQALRSACLAGLEYLTGSILRRWKRNWFALWLDGTLGYYHDETAQDEEDRVLIRSNVRNIKIGQECHGEEPSPFWHCDYEYGPPVVSVREHLRWKGPVPHGDPFSVCLPLDVQPPEGRSRDGLLTVSLREGSRLHLCAETQDDAV